MMPRLIPAGRLERLFANLLDTLFLFLPNMLLLSLLGETGPSLLAGLLCNLSYYVWFTASAWQATPGKRLLQIYVVMENGAKPTLLQSFERFISYILPTLPLYTSVLTQETATTLFMVLSVFWFLPIITTPERRGIHDVLAGTRVVTGRVGLA